MFPVPGEGGGALNDAVGVAPKAYCAAWERCVGVLKCPGFLVQSIVWRGGGDAFGN
jgi:hypothetical protein